MTRKPQLFWVLVLLVLVLGLGTSASQLNAQQRSDVTRAQAQEPQTGQQPARQPGQEYPPQQPGQQPQQPGQPPQSAPQPAQPGQQAPSPQAGQMPGVQTFTGMIVKSGDKYVLQDSSTGTTYDIDHQDLVSQHVGQRVRVSGTLDPDGKTIHLQPSGR